MSLFETTYELSLTKGYVSRWGMPQAVRELIQNSIDSESPFVYEFTKREDAWELVLKSEFSVLQPQTLLLGATSKAGCENAIGSFGEGYKIALLVLTRLGYDVEMRNGTVLWKPRFRFSKKFGEELLVIDEGPLSDKKNKGLTWVVRGLSESDVADVRALCLRMQDDVGEIKSTRYGSILMERPGMLYVGGLFVCKTELKFGYDVRPDHLKLERDRQTVDGFDLRWLVKDMWFSTGEWDRIAKMIDEGYPDMEYAEHSAPDLVKEACFKIFNERHPGAVAAKSQDQLRALIENGMTKVVVVREGFHAAVTGSSSYRSRPYIHIASPHEVLEKWYADAKYHMHAKVKASFADVLEQSKKWRLQS